MTDQDRTVSVIIAARDAGATIGRAVASALAEPEARQVILVDDASRDDTALRAREAAMGDPRLAIVRLEENLGPSAARNRALALATSAWICPLDGDDHFRPGRLARLLDQAQGCDLIADDLLMVAAGREGEPPGRLVGERLRLPAILDFAGFMQGNLSRPGLPRRELGFLKPLIRRDFLQRTGLAYDESVRLGEDLVLYAGALAQGAVFKLVEPCGYVAVEREGSLSGDHAVEDLRALLRACTRLAGMRQLTPADRRAAQRHLAQVRRKLHLREVLEARRQGGMLVAARALVRRAPDAAYIAGRYIATRRLPGRT